MTVSSTTNRKSFTGDGSTTAFGTSPVVFFDESELEVYLVTTATGASTLQTITTHYTVSGGAGTTGTVTMLTAPASTETLAILRVLPYTQTDDFVNNDVNDAEVLEDRLDKLTMMVQQLAEADDRGFKLTKAETGTAALTELPFDRASKFFAFGADKEPIASAGTDTGLPTSAFMTTVLDDTTAADALTTLGVSAFAQTVLDDTTAALARATLGSTTVGDAVFIAASTAAGRSALAAAGTGVANTFTAAQSFPDGSAAAPSISHAGDLDTGLYFGTNEVKEATAGVLRRTMDSNGFQTLPGQPAFSAHPSAGLVDVTGNGVSYTVAFDTEAFDRGGNFAANTFTAPITGLYQLSATVGFQDLTATNTDGIITINTSNRSYAVAFNPGAIEASATVGVGSMAISVLADMDIGDTADVVVVVYQGAQTVDVAATPYTRFTGHLVA